MFFILAVAAVALIGIAHLKTDEYTHFDIGYDPYSYLGGAIWATAALFIAAYKLDVWGLYVYVPVAILLCVWALDKARSDHKDLTKTSHVWAVLEGAFDVISAPIVFAVVGAIFALVAAWQARSLLLFLMVLALFVHFIV